MPIRLGDPQKFEMKPVRPDGAEKPTLYRVRLIAQKNGDVEEALVIHRLHVERVNPLLHDFKVGRFGFAF